MIVLAYRGNAGLDNQLTNHRLSIKTRAAQADSITVPASREMTALSNFSRSARGIVNFITVYLRDAFCRRVGLFPIGEMSSRCREHGR